MDWGAVVVVVIGGEGRGGGGEFNRGRHKKLMRSGFKIFLELQTYPSPHHTGSNCAEMFQSEN